MPAHGRCAADARALCRHDCSGACALWHGRRCESLLRPRQGGSSCIRYWSSPESGAYSSIPEPAVRSERQRTKTCASSPVRTGASARSRRGRPSAAPSSTAHTHPTAPRTATRSPLLQPCAAAPSLRAARESARWGAHNASQKQTTPIVRVGTGTGPHLRRTGVLVLAQTRSRAGGPAHAALMTGVYTDASRMPLRTPHARPTSMPAVPVVSGFGTCRHTGPAVCRSGLGQLVRRFRALRCAHCPSVRSIG